MSTNSRSEAVWQILHQAGALLSDRGFASPLPALPALAHGASNGPSSPPGEGYVDLAARYGEHLAFGEAWPEGRGNSLPRALILAPAPLSPQALAFVRSWFENATVKMKLDEDFFVQALPTFAGETPPYKPLLQDLCALLQPKAVLCLGALPAQRLLGAPLSLDTLRGSDFRFEKWSMITTLDPESATGLSDEALKTLKGQVWKDLQRLLGKLKYG